MSVTTTPGGHLAGSGPGNCESGWSIYAYLMVMMRESLGHGNSVNEVSNICLWRARRPLPRRKENNQKFIIVGVYEFSTRHYQT